MTTVQNEELSALLDGALSPERAAQVRAAIAADPALRAEHDTLARIDAGLAGLADDMAFMPEIVMRATTPVAAWHWAIGVAVVAALLIVRLLPKFAELALLGLALQAVGAAAILAAVIFIARERQSVAYSPA